MGGGVPEIIARLLESRGISADGIDEFLSPSLRDLAPPCELPNVDAAAEAMVRFCRERVNPAHLKGILTAPWAKAFTEETPKANAGIRLFAAAKRKIFP